MTDCKASVAFEKIEAYTRLHDEYRDLVAKYFRGIGSGQEALVHAIDGSLKMLDALNLREVLRASQPKRILEVGTFLGFSLRWICESAPAAEVVSVDPGVRHRIFDDPRGFAKTFNVRHSRRITYRDGFFGECSEGIVYDYVNYEPRISKEDALRLLRAIPVFQETSALGNFDFIFIDGDHSFKSTLSNIRLAAAMMPLGGTVVVHDALSWSQVEPAVKKACSDDLRLRLVGIAGREFEQFTARHYAWASPLAKTRQIGLRIIKRIYPRSIQSLAHQQKKSLYDGLAVISVSSAHSL
jgi:predicted O-methyltransferase YrrM